jgi:hypothetical protein
MLIPKNVIKRLVEVANRPEFVAKARPNFPARDGWRVVDDPLLWRMIVSQVCVVGNSDGWHRVRDSGDVDADLAITALAKQSDAARAATIHTCLRRHGVRYVTAEASTCRKSRALVRNFAFLSALPSGAKGYLQELARLSDDRSRVLRVSRDLAYIKNKGARDFLIELDLGRSLLAFDVRVLNLLKAAGLEVPNGAQGNKRRYEEIQDCLIELVCKPAGLTGAEFDRLLYRNYDTMHSEFLRRSTDSKEGDQ